MSSQHHKPSKRKYFIGLGIVAILIVAVTFKVQPQFLFGRSITLTPSTPLPFDVQVQPTVIDATLQGQSQLIDNILMTPKTCENVDTLLQQIAAIRARLGSLLIDLNQRVAQLESDVKALEDRLKLVSDIKATGRRLINEIKVINESIKALKDDIETAKRKLAMLDTIEADLLALKATCVNSDAVSVPKESSESIDTGKSNQ